jgi:hypothetical protein
MAFGTSSSRAASLASESVGLRGRPFTLKTYCPDQRSVEDVAADVLRAPAV